MRVTSEFEGGNAEAVEIVEPGVLRFSARADRSPRPLWFSFRIEDATVPSIRCELVNADRCFGPRVGWQGARPVFSPDGRRWQRATLTRYLEQSGGSGHFEFEVPVVGRTTHVAFSHPYTTSDLRGLVERARDAGGWRLEELCRSEEDRPVWLLTLGDPAAKRVIWVLARQHAGEAPASHVVEGLIAALVEVSLPSDVLIRVVPMVDVDGVFHGRYGKDQVPHDFNRDWHPGAALPQTRALMERMAADLEPVEGFVLDLHAPHSADRGCYFFAETIPSGSARLLEFLADSASPSPGFRTSDVRLAPAPRHSAREFAAGLGATALTLEVSYHRARDEHAGYCGPADYHQFGEALGRSLLSVLGESAPQTRRG